MSIDYTKFTLPFHFHQKAFNDPITPLLGNPTFLLTSAKHFIAISNYWYRSSELKLDKKNITLVKGFIGTLKWFQRLQKEIPWFIERARLLPRALQSTYTHMTTSTPSSSKPKERKYQADLKKGAKITATSIKSYKRFLTFLKNLKKSEIFDFRVKFSISRTIVSTADLVSKLFRMEGIIKKLHKAKTEQEKHIATKNAVIFLSKTIFSFIKFIASINNIRLSVGALLLARAVFFVAATSKRIDKNALTLRKKSVD